MALASSTVPTAFVTNRGAVAACALVGTSSVVATWAVPCPLGETLVAPGATVPIGIAGQPDLAAVTASGSTTLGIVEGYASPVLGATGGSGAQQVTLPPVTWTQTLVTLSAATAAPLVAANPNRRALFFMVTGVNPRP